jgi:hypothetical protein
MTRWTADGYRNTPPTEQLAESLDAQQVIDVAGDAD